MRGHGYNNNPIAMLIGIVMFLGSFIFLFSNEGYYIKNIKIANFVAKNVVNITTVSSAADGKLVHMSSEVKTDRVLSDEFVSVNTPVLKRIVEMYQWEEHSSGSSKHRSHRYEKVWSSHIEHVSDSAHRNPSSMPYRNINLRAKSVQFGDFNLTSSIIAKLEPVNYYTDFRLDNIDGFKVASSRYLYRGKGSIYNPEIGDIRISYEYLNPGSYVSIIAGQSGNILRPYSSRAGDIAIVENGKRTSAEMISGFKNDNKTGAISFRVLGFFLMVVGLTMIAIPVRYVLSFIGLGWFGEKITCGLAFLISIPLTIITISLAWLAFRPMLAFMSIGVCVAVVFLILMAVNKNK